MSYKLIFSQQNIKAISSTQELALRCI